MVFASLSSARAKARDARRITDIKQLQSALELYAQDNVYTYPSPYNADDNCGGWDVGNQSHALFADGRMTNFISLLRDPTVSGNCSGYFYYRYPAGYYGGSCAGKTFYVIGVNSFEVVSGFSSPGWSCAERNWQNEFQWVTGKFEN